MNSNTESLEEVRLRTIEFLSEGDAATPSMNKLRKAMRRTKQKEADLTRKMQQLEKTRQQDAEAWFMQERVFDDWGLLEI